MYVVNSEFFGSSVIQDIKIPKTCPARSFLTPEERTIKSCVTDSYSRKLLTLNKYGTTVCV